MACMVDDPDHFGVNANRRLDGRRAAGGRGGRHRRLFCRRAATGGETRPETNQSRVVQFVDHRAPPCESRYSERAGTSTVHHPAIARQRLSLAFNISQCLSASRPMTAVETPTVVINDPTIASSVAVRLQFAVDPPAGFQHRPDPFGRSRIGWRRSLRTRHGSLAFQSGGLTRLSFSNTYAGRRRRFGMETFLKSGETRRTSPGESFSV